MPRYLYIFRCQTPEQLQAKDPDESSEACFIEAGSVEEALEWGREVSERYVAQRLGEGAVSWKVQGFPHWIEPEPFKEYPEAALRNLQVVSCGNYPDF
jgi:hypothetical protein